MLRRIGICIALAILLAACGEAPEERQTVVPATTEALIATPTPRSAPNVTTIEPASAPTGTWTPPPPDSTPRPTSVPVTEEPRPRMPVADDIKLGDDGKYYAEVDGCRRDEYGRFGDAPLSNETVGMQTACLPYEGLHYVPETGEVSYFIQ